MRGRTHALEWLDFPDVVGVLPLLADGRIALVEQYRPTVNRACLEIPAGATNPGEAPEAAAHRELAEETGYRAGALTPLGAFYPAIGYSTERIFLYLATDLAAGATAFDEAEEIRLVHVTPEEMGDLIRRGVIADSKSLLAYLLWRQRDAGLAVTAGFPPAPSR